MSHAVLARKRLESVRPIRSAWMMRRRVATSGVDRAHRPATGGMAMSSRVLIYTDGACRGNPGPGGWAAVLRYGERTLNFRGRAKHDQQPDGTHGRHPRPEALKRPSPVALYTDSQYVQKGITEWLAGWVARGWRTASRTPVKNADLWQRLQAACAPHDIEWHWVKGHAGIEGNEAVDRLANLAIDELLSGHSS